MVVNKPRVSKYIVGFYAVSLIFLIIIELIVFFTSWTKLNTNGVLFLVIIFGFVDVLMPFILYRMFTMRYIAYKGVLTIRGIFNSNKIKISDIKNVRKTPIPEGFRLFGASFAGGYYYFPAIGKAWVAMANFNDGVLITTKNRKKYLITPSKPKEFIKKLKMS